MAPAANGCPPPVRKMGPASLAAVGPPEGTGKKTGSQRGMSRCYVYENLTEANPGPALPGTGCLKGRSAGRAKWK